MRFRHTITHDLQLPPFVTQWVTRVGNTAWTIDATPSVTVGALDESIIEAEFKILPGTYQIAYDITLSHNGILEVTFDKTNHSVTVGSGNTGSLAAGNHTGTINITVTDTSEGVQIGYADLSNNSNTIIINGIAILNTSHEISEPDGWKGAKIKLERDKEFFSLIEYYEGAAGGALIFYGDNGVEDGGINKIREIETNYGFDEIVEFSSEFDPDDTGIYNNLFAGLLDIPAKNEMKDNKMQVPVIRDDFWARFMARIDTPVSLSDLVDIDGNAVDPVEPITVNLTNQVIRRKYDGENREDRGVIDAFADNDYFQVDFDFDVLNEIDKKYNLPLTVNPERPANLFELEEAGIYTISIQSYVYFKDLTFGVAYVPANFGVDEYVNFFLQINDETPYEFSWEFIDFGGSEGINRFYLDIELSLKKGDLIRVYGRAEDPFTGLLSFFFWNSNEFYESNGYVSQMTITAQTTYPTTQAQGYLIHDLIHGVIARLGIGLDPFYSEFLGSTLTTTKQYDTDGCGWMYVILKGLQIRQYTLTEKPFFISFKEIWDGINPILNLGLGYEEIDSLQVIRIEEKEHFISSDGETSINFSNVREISSSYDKEFIFKKVTTGYKKWQSENASGIDDPQTKHVRATKLKTGEHLDIQSGFIAASLAVETTRRETKKKSADYKFDNDNFIIALNTDDVSPDVYRPELDENFNSVGNLFNSDTRYNLVLTPLRSLLRWIPYLNGCLQDYLQSVYKFTSGEGNYDMTSDYSCGSGQFCQAKSCDPRAENMDVDVNDDDFIDGYYFKPELYDIIVPMEWEEFELIRNNRKKDIGISQTDTDFHRFKIKMLEYDIVSAEATIKAWSKTKFNIQVVEGDPELNQCNLSNKNALLQENNDFILQQNGDLILLE